MPRFMFVALASVAFLGLLMPVVFLILSQKVTGVVEVNFGHSLKEQIKTVQDRSMELSIQLKELKNTASSIRMLAGLDSFQTESLANLKGISSTHDNKLSFLNHNGIFPLGESDLAGDQNVLFRFTPSIWPTKGWVTREFQEQNNSSVLGVHYGLDLAAREGAPVVAAADGVVAVADWDTELGWLVEINHGYNFSTRYGHNFSIRVDSGQIVRRGQIIALVGSTGRSSGPHLHYEVWKDDMPVNPRGYIPEMIHWEELLVSERISG